MEEDEIEKWRSRLDEAVDQGNLATMTESAEWLIQNDTMATDDEKAEYYATRAETHSDDAVAAEAADKALRLNPKSYLGLCIRAWVHAKRRDFIQAAEVCKAAIELKPELPRAYVTLSWASTETGDPIAGKEKAEEAIRLIDAAKQDGIEPTNLRRDYTQYHPTALNNLVLQNKVWVITGVPRKNLPPRWSGNRATSSS